MADDTMEISSEHGLHLGDEDIDIDIDFSAGHVDEDYMLEDAASHIELGEVPLPQPSPATVHDDLMIDDGDEQYSTQMDGTDAMGDDDAHNMDDESVGMPSTLAEIPTVLVEQTLSEDVTQQEDGLMNDEISWETNDEPVQIEDGTNIENQQTHYGNHEEEDKPEADLLEYTDVDYTDVPIASDSREPQASAPAVKDISEVLGGGRRSDSPPAVITAREAESQNDHAAQSSEIPNGVSALHHIVGSTEVPLAEGANAFSSNPDVVVIYQESEYSLFSKSETDDIDSYFLSDLSILDMPLNKLFGAIRDVIRDDLNDEDELFISAEDLGLDMEEMSSAIGTVTIGQIIKLHEKLLVNDGAEVRPLCLLLGARPGFSARFETLTTGAADGKGMSELVFWDENSEGIDESAPVTDNGHGGDWEDEIYELNDNLDHDDDEDEGQTEKKHPNQYDHDDAAPRDNTTNHESPRPAVVDDSAKVSKTIAASGTVEMNSPQKLHAAIEGDSLIHNTEAPGYGEDEDGDLIDYSDEEPSEPELRSSNRSPSKKLDAGNARNNAEYEAKNEELRRRSITLIAEEKPLEQAAEPIVTYSDAILGNEPSLESDNGIDYDENVDESGQAHVVAGREEHSTNFGEDHDHANGFDHHEDELYIEENSVKGDELVDGPDLTTEPTNEDDHGPFSDFDFEEDDDPQHQDFPTMVDGQGKPHDKAAFPTADHGIHLPKATPTGSSLGFADAPDSESSTSEKTLEAHPALTNDLTVDLSEGFEDEIDYDDDDEPHVLQVQEPSVKDLRVQANQSGKRARVDDDGSRADSQEAKRPRS